MILAAFVLALVVALGSAVEEVVVRTGKGDVRGIRVDSDKGFYYYSFRGVKYAQPPTGKLRFQDPVEVEDYEDEFDATDDGSVCPQFSIGEMAPIGDEDCLNINVYTPSLKANSKKAVIVYLHGGAFLIGGNTESTFGPEYLLNNDVVLVAVNYRLGPLGFLATKDGAATGNFGLKDQILALKWVQKNIAVFGGDPDNVTLMGEDSGAASATIHILSPEAKGLFHKVIAMSGNALCDHFLQTNPQSAAEELASRLDCSSMKGEDIVECLRRQTQQDIVKTTNGMAAFFSFPRFFVPVVDGGVLPEAPEALMAAGNFNKDVSVISGTVKDEGAFFYRLTLNTFTTGNYNDNFLDHKLPRILPVISGFHSKLYPITRLVRKHYFVNVDLENEDEFRPKYVDFLGDLLFTRCVAKFNNHLLANQVKTYGYNFEYRGQYSIVNLQGETVDMGVAHGDDMQYTFEGIWGSELTMSSADKKFITNIWTPLLTSFAKTAEPTTGDSNATKWDPMSPGKNNVYRVGNTLQMEDDFKSAAIKFWQEDIPKLFTKKSKTKKGGKDEL